MASLTLNWLNKAHSRQLAYEPNYPLLKRVSTHVPAGADAALADSPAYRDNWLIQGDNLQALKALLPFYRGQVKCIFIDPPYNTGSAFEHYHDKLEHTQWLHMMYPRLLLLRELLADDGSIWVTLDDNEAHYAKVLMDEVFGRQNFVANVVWEKSDSPKMDSHLFSTRHDHVLCFSKNISKFTLNKLQVETPEHYDKKDETGRIYYLKPLRAMGGQGDSREARPNLYFAMIAPDGSEVFPIRTDGKDGAWRWSKDKTTSEASRIDWRKGKNGWSVYFRIYADTSEGRPAETIWTHAEAGSNRTSKNEVNALFDIETVFGTPKPEALLKRVFDIATNPKDLVLDSFLGSGTTAAVAHKMGRRYIGIEMGEHALTHCLPRLEKVIAGEQGGISSALGWQGGGAFSTYVLGAQVFITQGKDKGKIDPAVRFADLAAYVWQQETRLPATQAFTSPCLGATQHDEGHRTAYYLLYNGILGDKRPESGNVLTYEVLAALDACFPFTASDGQRVVFGEACRVSPATLARANMSFKKIPYSLRAGKMI